MAKPGSRLLAKLLGDFRGVQPAVSTQVYLPPFEVEVDYVAHCAPPALDKTPATSVELCGVVVGGIVCVRVGSELASKAAISMRVPFAAARSQIR
ncbi:hypothetical protein D3C80_2009360 [compost metagenome]